MYRLLLIDDDAEFCDKISDHLAAEGLEVVSMHDAKSALRHVLASAPDEYDLNLLGSVAPEIDSREVLLVIRSKRETPTIMLTTGNRVLDCVVALETGADDHMVKPLDPRELLARARAVLRRTGKLSAKDFRAQHRLVLGDIELDTGSRIVWRMGEKLRLTSAEFSFLEMLLREAGHVVSRDRLARAALGRDLGAFDRSVDMHVSRLRKKLGYEHNGIERIKTVRGAGFVYTIPDHFACLCDDISPLERTANQTNH